MHLGTWDSGVQGQPALIRNDLMFAAPISRVSASMLAPARRGNAGGVNAAPSRRRDQ